MIAFKSDNESLDRIGMELSLTIKCLCFSAWKKVRMCIEMFQFNWNREWVFQREDKTKERANEQTLPYMEYVLYKHAMYE